MTSAKLIFLCGKMAAGKSTLARELARRENAILLVQDEFLDHLFPGEITDIPGFVKYSSRLKNALSTLALLRVARREWLRFGGVGSWQCSCSSPQAERAWPRR